MPNDVKETPILLGILFALNIYLCFIYGLVASIKDVFINIIIIFIRVIVIIAEKAINVVTNIVKSTITTLINCLNSLAGGRLTEPPRLEY